MNHIPWPRLLAESAAIVGSILFAFAIDAWWQNRQETTSDLTHLAAVVNELGTHRVLLQEAITAHERTSVAVTELLNYISSEGTMETTADVPVVLGRLLNFYEINAPFGALETAISAGAVPRMLNTQLATDLASWPVSIEDLLEEQNQGYQQMFRLLASLSDVTSLADVYKNKLSAPSIRGTGEIGDVKARDLSASRFNFNVKAVIENHQIENELLLLMILALSAQAEADSFAAKLDTLAVQLDRCVRDASC